MNDPWKSLQSAAIETLNPLWNDFAKEGRESAVLAPLAQYPNAAAWLARSMGMSSDYITRKLAAMLAGWIQDSNHVSILPDMLANERKVFLQESPIANSVGEDIMFGATRWTESQIPQVRNAGIDVLVSMINDALESTPWNTVNWAVANLYHATKGNHDILRRLITIDDSQIESQNFFRKAVTALRQKDLLTLGRLITPPSEMQVLQPDDPNYSLVSSLWKAAASAEAAR